MAEAIVPHLLLLLPIVQRQYARSSKYKQSLENLKVLIEWMDQFLKKANSMETVDERVQTSMKQARKFLYDSQDAIEDLMQHESKGMYEGLLEVVYKQYKRGSFVSQAEDISQRLNTYITTANETKSMVSESAADSAAPISAHHSSSTALSVENDGQLEGIDGAREQLAECLIRDDSILKVIFVHGAQGVGKTSLVGTVFRNAEVKRCFKYCVWVKHYNGLMDSNVEMWDLTTMNNQQVKLTVAFQRMRSDEDLSNNRRRWALVLDDTRKVRAIESLQGHLDPIRPSVLITTRDSSLELCAKELASASRTSTDTPGVPSGGDPPEKHGYVPFLSKVFGSLAWKARARRNSQQVQSNREAPDSLIDFQNFKHVSLSTNHSFILLRRKVFNEGPYPDDLEEDCKSILETCEGLPLAILATCDLLKQNHGRDNGTPRSVQWADLKGRLGEELLSKGHTSDHIRRMITLHMDQLHDVRACLFYLSIFPLGCPIRRSTLMRLWVAERFAMKEGRRTDQAIAEEYLKKLLDHNFIWEVEKTSYGRVRTCRVHNLQHEIIMKKSKDDEFAVIVADQEEEWPETIWRLSYHGQMHPRNDGEIFPDEVKRLRSLLVFDKVYRYSMEELLRHTVRLKVLHLEASSLDSFLTTILSLRYLRYLKLSGPLVTISKDIRNLVYLETLDLKGTDIRELPDGILELKKLRHLLVYKSDRSPDAVDPKIGVMVPSALGDFNSLQKLCMIELNSVKRGKFWGKHWKREQLLEGIGKLTRLQRLGISMLMSEDGGLLCSSIEKLTNLEALHLIAKPDAIIDLSEMKNKRKAPTRLQRVHLTGCFGKLSYWLLSPKSLVKLVLKRSQLNEDPLQHLGKLGSLQHLELQRAFDVHEMTFEVGWFPQLRFLGLHTIDSLRTIIVDEEALPTLEILSLARCPSLTRVPQDITRPKKLSCLELLNMPDEFKRSVKGNAAVCAKMTVKCADWSDGAVEVVVTLLDRPAGSPSDPRRLKK